MVFVKPKTRWGAAGYHLVVSMVIFVVLAAFIIFSWYPGHLFHTDGGWKGIKLIAGIDLVLGPFLTLIIYKATKKTLKFDLAFIAIVQISALLYGTWLVHNERPRAVILAEGVFRAVSASALPPAIADEAIEKMNSLGTSPVWIYTKPRQIEGDFEDDLDKLVASIKELAENGFLHVRYEEYQPFYSNAKLAKDQAIDPQLIAEDDEIVLERQENPVFQFSSRYATGLIELDADSLEYVALHKVIYGLGAPKDTE